MFNETRISRPPITPRSADPVVYLPPGYKFFYHGLEALAHRCSRVCSVSPQKYCPVPLAPMLEHVSIDIGT